MLKRLTTVVAASLAYAGLTVGAPAHSMAQEREHTTAHGQVEGVSVEPFRNVSAFPPDEWIGEGIAETLAVALGGTRSTEPPTTRWLVRGFYQREHDRLRITAELVDVVTGQDVDSVELDGKPSDLFALQDGLSARLAEVVSAHRTDRRSDLLPNRRAGRAGNPSPARRPETDHSPMGGQTGFSVGPTVIIDGPPPPVPPEVASRDTLGRLTMRAIALDAPLQLDGALDERVYRDVPSITGFIQQEPDEGVLATDQTEVWVLFDTDTLYVSARCWSTRPDRVVANEMKRDANGFYGNETLAVVLDTFYDRRNGFQFMTNALGGLFDATIVNERSANTDWNGIWDVRTARSDQGWTVEMAIPFKSLRYRASPTQIWGINVQRSVASTNEVSFLTPMPAALAFRGIYKFSSAATLTGLEVAESGTRLEIKPYGIADTATDFGAGGPAATTRGSAAGFDVKYGVTQGLTADFTYNTDFAQVEVDEQQVNLTRFGLFFPEKREFFLEGQGIFDFGPGRISGPTTFYFRGERYGSVTPVLFFSRRIGLNEGRTVPITAGGRLTGKTGPYTLGLLSVQTGSEPVSTTVPTNFSVVRIKRDVLRRSSVGALFTGRSVSIDQPGANRVYGVDGGFGFYDNLRLSTYLARSESHERHGDDLSYETQIDYSGDRWGVLLDHLAVGSNFNPEVGFLGRKDFRRNYGTFRFSPRPRSIQAVRKFLWEGSLDYTVDGVGLLETRTREAVFGIDFENGDRFLAGMTDNYEFLKEPFDISRSIAIPIGGYDFLNTRVVYALGNQRDLSGAVTFDRGGFYGGNRTSVGYFNGRLVLSPKLTFEPSVSFNWIDLPQGRFTTELVTVRATYTMTPRMFAAALVQLNTSAESLSTNLRFRWEYQPGSELFVVYTDERDTLTPSFPRLENRALVVKLTRLFRF